MTGQRYGLFCMVTCSWINNPGDVQRTSLNIKVNFPDLQVIVCPGGGGSDIAAGQIPGRGSRKIDGKDHAYLIDFWHPWDIRFNSEGEAKSGFVLHDDEKRRAKYRELGFEQIRVKSLEEIPFLRRQ